MTTLQMQLIENQRETLSLVARMLISKSEIEIDGDQVHITISDYYSDVLKSEKIQGELLTATKANYPGKNIEILIV